MNSQQVFEILKSKGFKVEKTNWGVVASLKRKLYTMEVWAALDGEIDLQHLGKIKSNSVGIICGE